ncbi:hypothetical protein PybrP1_005308 [[Pythium] brassicae (nom. inval.)]|nr:hypothetical protein PybrP1_005308 [[Pythium] brassicae (nom. inval.)]
MKNASPPEIVTVPVVISAPSVSGRRKSPSLKRSLSSRAPQSTVPTAIAVPTSSSTPTSPTGGDSSSSSSGVSVARATSDPGPPPALVEPLPVASAGPLRKTDSEREIVVLMPLAAAFLEQVKLEISVTKQHSEVRYVLSVQHARLGTTWQHVRSFDEYRRLQQRLLKLLNHGHFCRSDCPWMFTFLKSYFPKSLLFNFTSARVVGARKAALERFFATAQSFLLNRANHACGFLSAAVANELVEFIYGDVLKRYSLEQLSNAQPSVTGSLSSSSGILGIRRALADSSGESGSDEDDVSTSSCADAICQLCDSSLYGEARVRVSTSAAAAGAAPLSTERNGRTSSSLSVECNESLELDMVVASLVASVGAMAAASPTSSSWSSVGSTPGRRSTHYVTTLGCGHQFHDECVVPKLNETLRCPTCGHLEVK